MQKLWKYHLFVGKRYKNKGTSKTLAPLEIHNFSLKIRSSLVTLHLLLDAFPSTFISPVFAIETGSSKH